MSNNEKINISKSDMLEKLNTAVSKLEFISESIYNWNETHIEYKHREGFSSIMDEIIIEIKESTDYLQDN